MTTEQRLREALEEAERFIRVLDTRHPNEGCDEAADAIREALSLPAQEVNKRETINTFERILQLEEAAGQNADWETAFVSLSHHANALAKRISAQEGYVRVPVEPTDKMIAVWLTDFEQSGGASGGDCAPWMQAIQRYKAMLAAAQEGTGKSDVSEGPQVDPKYDWTEDFDHENGRYLRACVHCGAAFLGHKRRVVCRVCATKEVTK